jgi:hypothetical protein
MVNTRAITLTRNLVASVFIITSLVAVVKSIFKFLGGNFMTGLEIKNLIHKSGFKCWQVAELWGLCEGNFSRRLRKPFNDEEVERIKNILDELRANKPA